LGRSSNRRMQLADVTELTAVHHPRGAATGMKQLRGGTLIRARRSRKRPDGFIQDGLEPVERGAAFGRRPSGGRHGGEAKRLLRLLPVLLSHPSQVGLRDLVEADVETAAITV